jgi:hypothetical protein
VRRVIAGALLASSLTACAIHADNTAGGKGTPSDRAIDSGSALSSHPLPEPESDPVPTEPLWPGSLTQRCESPLGYAMSYPHGWWANAGAVVAACSRFAPAPIRVPPGTDVRVGAVSATVEPVTLDRAAEPGLAEELSRTTTTVDGRDALRLEWVTDGAGLWPQDTRWTTYLVELPAGEDGPRTLVLTTVGLPSFDYARNISVLDRMIESISIQADPHIDRSYKSGEADHRRASLPRRAGPG